MMNYRIYENFHSIPVCRKHPSRTAIFVCLKNFGSKVSKYWSKMLLVEKSSSLKQNLAGQTLKGSKVQKVKKTAIEGEYGRKYWLCLVHVYRKHGKLWYTLL